MDAREGREGKGKKLEQGRRFANAGPGMIHLITSRLLLTVFFTFIGEHSVHISLFVQLLKCGEVDFKTLNRLTRLQGRTIDSTDRLDFYSVSTRLDSNVKRWTRIDSIDRLDQFRGIFGASVSSVKLFIDRFFLC